MSYWEKVNQADLGATDAGGPRREYIDKVCDEVINKLKLFIPSPNNKHNVGDQREKLVPNPVANSHTDMANFYKFGMLLAMSLKINDVLPISLHSSLFSYLLGNELAWTDIRSLNLNQVVCIEKMAAMSDEDIESLEETFVAYLNDGKEFELLPNGRNIKITGKNRWEYINLTKRVHLAQLQNPYDSIREGFRTIMPKGMIENLTPAELERYVTGMDYVDINVLKNITQYRNFGLDNPLDHPSIQYFWQILGEFTQEELSSYLRFVWGRSRLSASQTDIHRVSYVSGRAGLIPETHTCFFEIDIFDYPSIEDFRKKLKYGMQNCGIIVESGNTLTFSFEM